MTIRDCLNCGGTHFGSNKCPYLFAPCVVCGRETEMACADCAIDSGGKSKPHVCDRVECRDVHERDHVARHAADTSAQTEGK